MEERGRKRRQHRSASLVCSIHDPAGLAPGDQLRWAGVIVRLSAHAQVQLQRRRIPLELLNTVLRRPEQILRFGPGSAIYQSRLDFGHGKIYLLRALVAEDRNPPLVITAYRTSKIEKYWRSE
ncbi:MAG: DUF4258 domain-containing protein [Acidobacteria bacterium]|nr:DUF4258 domain-containing protein [Acidobacteriota bacterium]